MTTIKFKSRLDYRVALGWLGISARTYKKEIWYKARWWAKTIEVEDENLKYLVHNNTDYTFD